MSDPFKIRKSRKRPKLGNPPKVYVKPGDKQVGKLVKRAMQIREQLAEVKPLYNELDQIVMSLTQVNQDKLDRHGVSIVDIFASKNTQFKTVGITRYQLEWKR